MTTYDVVTLLVLLLALLPILYFLGGAAGAVYVFACTIYLLVSE